MKYNINNKMNNVITNGTVNITPDQYKSDIK